MSALSLSRFSVGIHPRVRPGLDALIAYLCEEGYHSHAIGVIVGHVAREETLEGLVEAGQLEPADEAEAERVYVDALAPLAQTAPEWSDPAVYLDADSLLEAWERQQAEWNAAELAERSVALRDPDGSIRLDVDEVLLAAMEDRPY